MCFFKKKAYINKLRSNIKENHLDSHYYKHQLFSDSEVQVCAHNFRVVSWKVWKPLTLKMHTSDAMLELAAWLIYIYISLVIYKVKCCRITGLFPVYHINTTVAFFSKLVHLLCDWELIQTCSNHTSSYIFYMCMIIFILKLQELQKSGLSKCSLDSKVLIRLKKYMFICNTDTKLALTMHIFISAICSFFIVITMKNKKDKGQTNDLDRTQKRDNKLK